MSESLDRRRFLRSVATVAAGMAALPLLQACSKSTPAPAASDTTQPAGSSAPTPSQPAPREKITLKLGHILAAGDPTDQGATRFAELVSQRTDGQVEVQIFPASQLGSGPQQIEQVQAGALDLFVGGIAWFEAFKGMEDLKVFSLPHLFKSTAEPKKVLDSELGARLFGTLEKDYSISTLAYNWWWPPRQVMSKSPVASRDDLKGMKLRVPEVEMYVVSWKALGAVPTPIAWGETYTALQQGVADAVEAGMTLMYNSKFSEVVKHMTITNHTMVPVTFIANRDGFAKLPADVQQVLRTAAVEAGEVSNAAYVESEGGARQQFAGAGVQIHELTDRADFFAPLNDLAYQLENEGKWTKGLYDQIQGMIG